MLFDFKTAKSISRSAQTCEISGKTDCLKAEYLLLIFYTFY